MRQMIAILAILGLSPNFVESEIANAFLRFSLKTERMGVICKAYEFAAAYPTQKTAEIAFRDAGQEYYIVPADELPTLVSSNGLGFVCSSHCIGNLAHRYPQLFVKAYMQSTLEADNGNRREALVRGLCINGVPSMLHKYFRHAGSNEVASHRALIMFMADCRNYYASAR
jgi:hypothetical protein